MRIDVRKLNVQKKYSGSMEFDYSPPESLIEIPFVKFAGPAKVSFEYELFEDDSLEIRGSIFLSARRTMFEMLEGCSAIGGRRIERVF